MLSTSKLSGVCISKKRLLITSILGGFFSLTILLEMSTTLLISIKVLMGFVLTIIGFHSSRKLLQLVKCIVYFLAINFIYAGIMLSIFILFAPSTMAYKNGVVYFNITALNLVISTTIAYLIVNILIRVLDKKTKTEDLSQIKIIFMGREVILTGLNDTGNKLNDIFTGLPVVVCEYNAVKDLFPHKLQEYFKIMDTSLLSNTNYSTYSTKLRLVPVNVVGANLVLPAFKPDEITIGKEKIDVIIAVTDQNLSSGEFNAII